MEELNKLQVIGPYQVKEVIGKGRYCTTYRGEIPVGQAHNVSTPQIVALKFYETELYYKSMLRRELCVLNNIVDSQYLVKLYFHHEEGDTDVLVEELLDGTVTGIISEKDKDTSPSAWFIHVCALHVARGLWALHSRGMMHGDISPNNIMWRADSANFVLIDFGSAVKPGELYCHLIQSKVSSAPEVLDWASYLADRDYDKVRGKVVSFRPTSAADVWALGCCVLKIMTGSRQFEFHNLATRRQVDVDNFINFTLNSLVPRARYPPEFIECAKSFLSRCMRVDPRERATAQELSLPWSCAHNIKPAFDDCSLLPCPVIKIENVADPGTTQREAKIDHLIHFCRVRGTVLMTEWDEGTASLVLYFSDSLDSGTVFTELKKLKTYNERDLVVTFDLERVKKGSV